jgi:phosphopantetheine--protein transferase-like protein
MAALGAGDAEAARPILQTPRGGAGAPPGFVASVSHKREIAVAIAARAEPTPRTTIGIDVEIPRSLRIDIAPRVLTPVERAEIAGLDQVARDAEVLLRFAAKEAIYKALDPWVRRLVSFQEVEIAARRAGGARCGSRSPATTAVRASSCTTRVTTTSSSSWLQSRPKRNDGRLVEL